jgi:micrococcal nuclease
MHFSLIEPARVLLTARLDPGPWWLALLMAHTVANAEGVAGVETPTLPTVYEARVTRVSDGDTLWVKPLAGGRYRKLRLDGIDAPEICQDGGMASRDALAARVLEQVVTVHERHHDTYGRALVRLTHSGTDVAARLVLQGHAWSHRWRRSLGPYAQQEAWARKQRMGIFQSDASAELPRDFRQRHGPCPLP